MAKRRFRYDLVERALEITLTVLQTGVEHGMRRDEILLYQAMLNHEIDVRLLTAGVVTVVTEVSPPDKPDGEDNGPKH